MKNLVELGKLGLAVLLAFVAGGMIGAGLCLVWLVAWLSVRVREEQQSEVGSKQKEV
jgi:hypothetical protein